MIFVYNFLQAVLLLAAFPLLLLIVVCKEKYRSRIAGRLGFGLKKKAKKLLTENRKIVWIHALSVGEVTSALPLVKGIQQNTNACIIFSASTSTGISLAQDKIGPHVDIVIPAPLDLLPVVHHFIKLLHPNLFILVETDFWPNWLSALRRNHIPLVLVNGRISASSFAKYKRFNWFFSNIFQSFSLLSMQTENDARQMQLLGASVQNIKTLGNLKYDTYLFAEKKSATITTEAAMFDDRIPQNAKLWVCGSTHPGEEEILVQVFAKIYQTHKDLFLLLAPRDPGRTKEIQSIFSRHGLQSMRRTFRGDTPAPVLILDTIGELAESYRYAWLAFIGGSLIDYGGHNPLEAAAQGVPVLFGSHMSDFLEIAHDLKECGGGLTVNSADELEKRLLQLIDSSEMYQKMSLATLALIQKNSGVVDRHLQEINKLLQGF